MDAGASALTRWRARRRGVIVFERIGESSPERRCDKRRRTRFAWGKALDDSGRFLCDCLIADRSVGGARVLLARRVALPRAFRLFDDGDGRIYGAAVVWRRESEVGCRLFDAPSDGRARAERRMGARLYAV